MMYVEIKEPSGFTPYFDGLLRQVSSIEAGKDVPELTRLNIAMQNWQEREFGDVYPKKPTTWKENERVLRGR